LARVLLCIQSEIEDAMPPFPPRRRTRPRESLMLKSFFVVTVLLMGSLVIGRAEVFFSPPAGSLSAVEASLRLAAR
jgi:hypothetical protein